MEEVVGDFTVLIQNNEFTAISMRLKMVNWYFIFHYLGKTNKLQE